MGPKTTELVNELEGCASFLRECSEVKWAYWLENSASLLKSGQISGIDHYKGAFGGMGSINDLVLHPINGHTIKETEINSANEKLKVYFSTICQLAEEVTKHAVFNE